MAEVQKYANQGENERLIICSFYIVVMKVDSSGV